MSQIIARLQQHAREQSDALALVSEQGFTTYAELEQRVAELAGLLRQRRPRLLALALGNGQHWIEVQLAALAAGVPVVPVPPFFSAQQVAHLMSSCAPDLLLCESADKRFSGLESRAWHEFSPCAGWLETSSHPELPAGTALITFTSGTTGTPKGVCISPDLLERVCASLFEVTESLGVERHVCLLPLAVMLEHLAGVLLPLYSGALVMIYSEASSGLNGSSGVDLAQLASFLKRQSPQSLILTPELLRALLLLTGQGLTLPSLKFVAVGGGRVAPKLLAAARQAGLPVYEGYGLSEAGSVVALNLPGADKPGSVGRVLPHCRVSISEAGEVLVAGAAMSGYLGAQEQGAGVIATGDLGELDDEGFLFIRGRLKQVQISSFGRNFSPEWLEAELMTLPAVRRAVVFGDQLPAISAVFELMPGADQTGLAAQLAQLNAGLPDYARVRHLLIAAEPFSAGNEQLTANGRLRREALWYAYREQLQAFYPGEYQHIFSDSI